MRLNKIFVASITLLSAVSNQATSMVTQDKVSWPGKNWEVSTPALEGVNTETMTTILEEISTGVYGSVDHFIVIRNGRIIADNKYVVDYDALSPKSDTTQPTDSPVIPDQYNYDDTRWHPFYQGSNLHTLQSVTKSITSAAFGIAIDKGLIKNVEQPIYPYFKNYQYDTSDPRKLEITIEDVLTMRAGIDWYTEGGYDNNKHSTVVMENSSNWLQYILDRPMDKKPGTHYEYNDGASVLLGKILSEATGLRADEWTKKQLFTPIGINNFNWKLTPKGEADTEGGLYLSTYDLARVGYLFLREGQWKDKQIISKEWVKKSITPLVDNINPDNNKVNPGYGYQWYISGKGDSLIYLAAGYGGQYIVVAPAFDLLMVVNSWSLHKKSTKSLYKIINQITSSITTEASAK